MTLPQLRQEFDLLEVVAAIVELEWQRLLAHLTDHLAIAVNVLLPEILRCLLLDIFPADRDATGALLGDSLRRIVCQLCYALRAPYGVTGLVLRQVRTLLMSKLSQHTFLLFDWNCRELLGTFVTGRIGE